MNGYSLSRAFCEFSFDNNTRVKPTHYAIYFFAIDHCNSLGWKDTFGLPTSMVMEAIGIKKIATYTSHLKDLVEWGFIEMVQKSVNQNTSNIVRLVDAVPKKGAALGKARSRHEARHTALRGNSTGQGTVTVYKPLNLESYKPLNLLNFETEKFHKKYIRREIQDSIEHPPLVSTTVGATDVATSIHDPALAAALLNYHQYQVSRGRKVDTYTVKADIAKCLAMAPADAIAAIDTAISGNFPTFFAKSFPSSGTGKGSRPEVPQTDPRDADYAEGIER